MTEPKPLEPVVLTIPADEINMLRDALAEQLHASFQDLAGRHAQSGDVEDYIVRCRVVGVLAGVLDATFDGPGREVAW